MIERYVFIKLRDEHATDAGRAEVVAEAERLFPGLPGVVSVRVGLPADARAAKAWDVSLVVEFARRDEVAAYQDHPDHRRFVDAFLAPRVAVIKAWSMDVKEARLT
jgi:hypothetical protein